MFSIRSTLRVGLLSLFALTVEVTQSPVAGAEAMPEPQPGVRSIGQQVVHTADAGFVEPNLFPRGWSRSIRYIGSD